MPEASPPPTNGRMKKDEYKMLTMRGVLFSYDIEYEASSFVRTMQHISLDFLVTVVSDKKVI